MNIFQIILDIIKKLFFKDKNFKGALPAATGGDQIYTPTINMDGNWIPYMSQPYESQYIYFDQLDCVSVSGANIIEAILNYFYKNRLFPVQAMYDLIEKGGFLNDKGYIELSSAYIAKMAGTTPQGLRMDAFWVAVNNYGMVPKKYWNKDTARTWDEYYAPIPDDVLKAGLLFAKIFRWNWQVILNDSWIAPPINTVRTVLSNSPIHFATALCPRDNSGVMRYCGAKVYQHARALTSITDYQEILDQYSPFLTRSETSYPLGCAIKVALKID